MSIPTKDQKILWAKAAGLCSMPDCRNKLVHDASDAVPSKKILFGQNCHIVAESEDGPRGKSILTIDERNRYPNLILLCVNHHKVIDEDPSSWPVEKLHQIKSDHEIWIETRLIAKENDEVENFYTEIINLATESLCLKCWDWFSDHAVRLLLFDGFVSGVDSFFLKVNKAIWPKKHPDLEKAIINLSERLNLYTIHFLSKSKLRADDFHIEDKWWKYKFHMSDYLKYEAESLEWQQKATKLLFNVVVALNEFADSVRKDLNPHFFLSQGKFIVNDEMGVISEMKSCFYVPDKYIET